MESFENKGQNGLPNVGNSCYLNSTIQCLAGTDELIKYFSQTATLSNGKVVKKYEGEINKGAKNFKTSPVSVILISKIRKRRFAQN